MKPTQTELLYSFTLQQNFLTPKTLSCIEEVMRRNLKNDILLRFLSVFRLYGLGGKKGERKIIFVHLRGERNGCTTIQWWIYIQRSPSMNARRKIKKNEFSRIFLEILWGFIPFYRFFGFCFFYFCVIKKNFYLFLQISHRMQFISIFIKKYYMGKFEIRKRRFLLVRSASFQFPLVQ